MASRRALLMLREFATGVDTLWPRMQMLSSIRSTHRTTPGQTPETWMEATLGEVCSEMASAVKERLILLPARISKLPLSAPWLSFTWDRTRLSNTLRPRSSTMLVQLSRSNAPSKFRFTQVSAKRRFLPLPRRETRLLASVLQTLWSSLNRFTTSAGDAMAMTSFSPIRSL